jgi:hypothetical protein
MKRVLLVLLVLISSVLACADEPASTPESIDTGQSVYLSSISNIGFKAADILLATGEGTMTFMEAGNAFELLYLEVDKLSVPDGLEDIQFNLDSAIRMYMAAMYNAADGDFDTALLQLERGGEYIDEATRLVKLLP